MSEERPEAQKDKDVELRSDSPGPTQEPLLSHTFSLKNNAAGLSSDEHENPLNGTQPKPFVYSSAPAVPHADNSLPSGALVNGPGSHPSPEVHSVLNKGSVLSNNVLDAAWQVQKDTSPEVLVPPSELQSDARMNPAGLDVRTLPTQPGVNTPLSHSEDNESKLAYSTLSPDSVQQMHVSQLQTKHTIKTSSQRDSQWSQSSSDDYEDEEEIRWEQANKHRCFMKNDRWQETNVTHRRGRKHKTHAPSMSGTVEKVNCSLNDTLPLCSGNNVENVDIANKDDTFGTQCDIKYSVVRRRDHSRNTAPGTEQRGYSTAEVGSNEANGPEEEDTFSPNVKLLKTEQLEQKPLFIPRTICNVNFEEKRHFHRRSMMYHLGRHNQVNSENAPQPFICRKCGRLFCDSNSLMSHIIIHRDRLAKLMEEIKGLRRAGLDEQGSRVHCPQCSHGCNSPKVFVQPATEHDNLKHYYFCQECDYISLTLKALEAHLLLAHQRKYQRMVYTNDAHEANRVECRCIACSFTTDQTTLDSEHQHLYSSDYKKFSDHRRKLFIRPNSPQVKHQVGCNKNVLSPCLWEIDKHGNLLPHAAEKLDVATDLTSVEKEYGSNNDREAFGSTKQTDCLDFLVRAESLKLDQLFCQESKSDPSSKEQANQNSPLLREISTTWQNTIDNVNSSILPKLSQRPQKRRELWEDCKGNANFSNDTSEAICGNERDSYPSRYFTKRPRFSGKDKNSHVSKDDEEEDCSDIEQLIIKEECIETTVTRSESPLTCRSIEEQKPCPYCPAVFESGVGLSNHVRGHLHRAGLSYDARHVVSPEQVARRDCDWRIRRRVATGKRRPVKGKGLKTETQQTEYTCPLCKGWFDTKTGLSNHVRGHLKRMGRSLSTSTNKSPLCALNELMQNNREHQATLQVLVEKPPSPQKFICRDDFFLMPTGTTVQKVKDEMTDPALDCHVTKEGSEKEQNKDKEALSSTLVNLLRTAQVCMQPAGRDGLYASRKPDLQVTCMEQDRSQGESASDKVWIGYNNTFPDAVYLSGHIQACARRRRIGILGKTGYDYKNKRLRPRPGLKKRIIPSLNAEIYTLTCRFCNLVFQGPLSVQEDWIRHLQRHLLHNRVPHSGTGMVEVTGLYHNIHTDTSHEHS